MNSAPDAEGSEPLLVGCPTDDAGAEETTVTAGDTESDDGEDDTRLKMNLYFKY